MLLYNQHSLFFVLLFNIILFSCKESTSKPINTKVLDRFDKDILKNKETIISLAEKKEVIEENKLLLTAFCNGKLFKNKSITILVEQENLEESIKTNSEGKFSPSTIFLNKEIICKYLACSPTKVEKNSVLNIKACPQS